jgi:hypothetical protein
MMSPRTGCELGLCYDALVPLNIDNWSITLCAGPVNVTASTDSPATSDHFHQTPFPLINNKSTGSLSWFSPFLLFSERTDDEANI